MRRCLWLAIATFLDAKKCFVITNKRMHNELLQLATLGASNDNRYIIHWNVNKIFVMADSSEIRGLCLMK